MSLLPEPLHDVATTTRSAVRRLASLSPDELRAIVDGLADLVMDLGAASVRLPATLPLVRVIPADERWMVLAHGEPALDPVTCDSKREATDRARELARTHGGTLVLHRLDGSIMQTFHYGSVDHGSAEA